jgi:hypothetical protein
MQNARVERHRQKTYSMGQKFAASTMLQIASFSVKPICRELPNERRRKAT